MLGRRGGVICSVNKIHATVLHERQMQLIQIQLSNRTNISKPGREIKNERAKFFFSPADKREYMPLLSKHTFCRKNFLCRYFSFCLNKTVLHWNIGCMWVVGPVGPRLRVKTNIWLTKEQDDSSEVGDLCSCIYELKINVVKDRGTQAHVRLD